MMSGLGSANSQNATNPRIANVAGNLSEGQAIALIQTVGNNPVMQQRANALTGHLRQQRQIGPNQQVVGFDGGRIFVASNADVAAANRSIGVGRSPGSQPETLVNGLARANVRTLSIQGLTNVNGLLNETQANALYQALNNNAQARQAADALTMDLLIDGRIRADQRVVGLYDGRIVVTPATR